MIAACSDSPTAGPPPPPADAEPPPAVPRIEAAACRFEVPASLGVEGQQYDCGDLIVYEDRAIRGRTIQLHFARFDSASASTNATIYLDGGPGGDGEAIIAYAGVLGAAFLDGLRADGDFLVLGQRGTARSVPYLACEAPGCSDFASRYDLAMYNTAANADDIDELRAALGYTRLNLYGISYGSRLALEVMRRHGGRVRAAVIDGVVPSSVVWPAAIPASFYSALTALHRSCAAAEPCSAAYGDLVHKLHTGLASLRSAPLPLHILGGVLPLDSEIYAYLLFQMMYARGIHPWLPMMISDVAQRRADRVEALLEQLFGGGGGGGEDEGGVSPGLYYAVVCGEIFNPPDPDAFDQLNAEVPDDIVGVLGSGWHDLAGECSSWPVGDPQHQQQLAQPVGSPVRTLVSSGRIDPITPPGFAAIAASTLSDAAVVVHEDSAHGATLQSSCGVQNLTAFLADPAAPHDTSCAADLRTAYVVPAQVAATPVPRARIRAELRMAPRLPRAREVLARLYMRGMAR